MRGTRNPAHASGQYLIGGDLPVYRLGYGTMQLTGPGHWYHPADPRPSNTSSARPCTPTRRAWSSPPRAA